MRYEAIYDISVLLGVEDIDYPGTPPYSRELIYSLKNGDTSNISRLIMSTHSGTHLDAPSHFIPNGKNIDEYPAKAFILPAHVVPIEDKEMVQPSELEKLDTGAGDALLFKTDNSISGRSISGEFSGGFVCLSPEAADFCVERKLGLVGIDYNTIEPYRTKHFPVHEKLLYSGILILESINLRDVPPGRYTLLCLPLKMKDAEASPVRAILIR